ncbi:hypothetical protein SAMN02745179_00749 [Mycoplasmopsis agassizii]|uniref:Uncharacterized protein n=1 Tax=Mycoplasmopsis agassizii TaxID=33922 RepID=A0ABX4H4L4_9BACT|nr:hypothetical protein CJF60_03740 [Mycoplasmopsis agassizii]SMC18672.1 hypothetical protein SAMN02745179_00749 [Mycoplasmopsis agassizii]
MERLLNERIQLPTNELGNINWNFIENFIKKFYSKKFKAIAIYYKWVSQNYNLENNFKMTGGATKWKIINEKLFL